MDSSFSPFSIRPATLADVPSIASVNYHSWQSTYRGLIAESFLQTLTIETAAKRWQNIIENNARTVFTLVLTDKEGTVIGYLSGGENRIRELPVIGEIFAIYLLQEHQGRGLGKTLFQEGIRTLQNKGITSFSVSVLAANTKAIRFYRSFKPDLEMNDEIELGDDDYSEICFGWSTIF